MRPHAVILGGGLGAGAVVLKLIKCCIEWSLAGTGYLIESPERLEYGMEI